MSCHKTSSVYSGACAGLWSVVGLYCCCCCCCCFSVRRNELELTTLILLAAVLLVVQSSYADYSNALSVYMLLDE